MVIILNFNLSFFAQKINVFEYNATLLSSMKENAFERKFT